MKKIWKLLLVLALVLSTSALFAAAQGEAMAGDAEVLKPQTFSWTAGGMGGGWYTQAGGMAAIVKNNVPEITIKVLPGGGIVNPAKVDAAQDDFGWGVGYIDKAAFSGAAPMFDKPYKNIRGLAGNFSVDFYHFLAAKTTGITTIDELVAKIKAGEKINLAGPMVGTSDRSLTELVFNSYGLSYQDIEKNGGRVIYAVYGDMVNLYKDRHVDYVITCLGLPGSAVTEMTLSRPSVLLQASDKLVKFIADTYGTVPFESGLNVIPAGTYSGIDVDTQQIGHSTEIIARVGLPDIVAYNFVKTLMENIEEVQSLNPSFKKYFSKEVAPQTMVPLHPGAERYYREIGVIQ